MTESFLCQSNKESGNISLTSSPGVMTGIKAYSRRRDRVEQELSQSSIIETNINYSASYTLTLFLYQASANHEVYQLCNSYGLNLFFDDLALGGQQRLLRSLWSLRDNSTSPFNLYSTSLRSHDRLRVLRASHCKLVSVE